MPCCFFNLPYEKERRTSINKKRYSNTEKNSCGEAPTRTDSRKQRASLAKDSSRPKAINPYLILAINPSFIKGIHLS